MAFHRVVCAIAGVSFLVGCVSNDVVGRSDTSNFTYSMTSMIDERDVYQSLAAVSMKELAGQPLQYSPEAMKIIADYGN